METDVLKGLKILRVDAFFAFTGKLFHCFTPLCKKHPFPSLVDFFPSLDQ